MKSMVINRLAQAHYLDAWLYDRRYQRRRMDLSFYHRLAKRAGRCLELGAGTGRVTQELLAAGASVVAVEQQPELIASLRATCAKATAKVEVIVKDFRHLHLARRFPLVVAPFNTLSHLYTSEDANRVLQMVRRHLLPGGLFAFDIPLPDVKGLALDPTKRYRVGSFVGRDKTRYHYYESFDYDPLTQLQTIIAHYDHEDGGPEHGQSFVLPLLHRHFFPLELDHLLQTNGFVLRKRDGDFNGGPLTASSESQVVICAKAPVNNLRRS